MANKKISQLSATTEANDNVFLVMNNSGNTETFRIKRSDLLSGTTFNATTLPEYTGDTYNGFLIWNDTGNTTTYRTKQTNSYVKRLEVKDLADTNTINANVKSALVLGEGNTISSTDNKNYFILGNDNTINATIGGGQFAMVIGNNAGVSAFGGICIGGFSSVGGERAFRWGNNGNANGQESFSWGEQVNVAGIRSIGFGSYMTITPSVSYSFGANNNITTSTNFQGIFGGQNNTISATGADGHNFILGSKGSTISGTSQFVSLIGLSGFTSPTQNNTTYVDNIQVINKVVLRDYTNLDFADDAAAALGGIPLGGVYHTSGSVKVRIT